MRTVEAIQMEIEKVEKAQKAAIKKQERCVDRLAELKTELSIAKKNETER